MARMYSRARGKSGSNKPKEKKVPVWMGYKPVEIEKLIIKLAKAGKTASEIGLYLRDNYGIPDVRVATKKKITRILEENKLLKEIPEDVMALMKKNIQIRKHLESNHKDMTAKHGLELTGSKILRLVRYYQRVGRLPEGWKFDPERIKLYVG
ncbi:30S ribosomal protein S15 [Candidatus Woesearchaeota archaeon]|nr:30S ribosomal protein S15 [Candidatus Woesearchaeota archaeon]